MKCILSRGEVKDFLLLEGDDFNYIIASEDYREMDKVMKYINDHASDYELKYSTPSIYYQNLLKTAKSKHIVNNVLRRRNRI